MPVTPTSSYPSRIKRLEAVDSSTPTDRCKDYPNAPECQKPVSTNAITIVVAIVVPVGVILIILGALWYMNWRKDRKEAMDHDPDFDENGEATALPDFLPPRFHPGPGQPEDPFSNSAASARSFPKPQYRSGTMTTTDAASIVADPYLEDFVLPYLHQTSSKISLNEYARQLGDSNTYGRSHSHSPSGTSHFGSRPPLVSIPKTDSPQKSHLSRQVLSSLPPVMRYEHDYNPLLNNLQLSVDRPALTQDASSNLTDSRGGMGIQYENESSSQNGKLDSARLSFAMAELDSRDNSSSHSRVHTTSGLSPFHSHYVDAETNAPSPPPLQGHDPNFHGRRSIAQNQRKENDMVQHEHPLPFEVNTLASQRGIPPVPEAKQNIVKFNEPTASGTGPKLLDEQIEDLQRLKSVYRVYFDKNDAGVDPNATTADLEKTGHVPDENEPANATAAADITRSSVVSSVYPEAHDVTRESHFVSQNDYFTAEHGYDPHAAEQYPLQGPSHIPLDYQHEPLRFPNHPRPDEGDALFQASSRYVPDHVDREPVYQAPLKQLKNASDHRMSSIETFTDFEPKHNRVGLPRPGIVPGGGDLHWDGSFESPTLKTTLSGLTSNSNLSGQVPSASQLARQLIVMVDPVAGIPYQKGFRPAGSSKLVLPQLPDHHTFGTASSLQSDLIPGNRKSDVRRMMNTNF